MKRSFLLWLWLALMFVAPIPSYAISGYYSDPGGGSYWCNVYVQSVSDGKSYSWCTGIAEDTGMNNFRGFESEHNGKISIQHPTIMIKFRYHYGQPKGFNYNGSQQDLYVMTRDGSLHKIGEWPKGGKFTQTDYTYGMIGEGSMANDWFTFYYTPNQAGLDNVTAIQIENDTYYSQDHFWFWDKDYSFQLHSRYLKSLDIEFEQCRDAELEWTAPNKVKVSADNSWLHSPLGEHVDNFYYKSSYKATVYADNRVYNSETFDVINFDNKSVEIDVPGNKTFLLKWPGRPQSATHTTTIP